MKLTKLQAQHISKLYSIGNFQSIKEIKGGSLNYNFLLLTDKGSYVVRILGKKLTPDKIKTKSLEFKVLTTLYKKEFPYAIPVPILSNKKTYLSKLKEKNYWVYQYLQGEPSLHLNTARIKSIAKALATYHSYVTEIKNPKLNNNPFSMDWLKEKYTIMEKVIPMNKTDRLMKKNFDFFNTIMTRINNVSYTKNQIPIHGDLGVDNVLWKNNTLVAILDFDNIEIEPRIIDIANSINYTCFVNNKLNKKRLNLFLKEYNLINPLSKEEKILIIPAILRYLCALFWWNSQGVTKEIKEQYNNLESTIHKAKELIKLYN